MNTQEQMLSHEITAMLILLNANPFIKESVTDKVVNSNLALPSIILSDTDNFKSDRNNFRFIFDLPKIETSENILATIIAARILFTIPYEAILKDFFKKPMATARINKADITVSISTKN